MATRTALRRTADQTADACTRAKQAFLVKRDELRVAADSYNAALLAHTQACEALSAAYPDAPVPAAPTPVVATPPRRSAEPIVDPPEAARATPPRGFFRALFGRR